MTNTATHTYTFFSLQNQIKQFSVCSFLLWHLLQTPGNWIVLCRCGAWIMGSLTTFLSPNCEVKHFLISNICRNNWSTDNHLFEDKCLPVPKQCSAKQKAGDALLSWKKGGRKSVTQLSNSCLETDTGSTDACSQLSASFFSCVLILFALWRNA